LLFTVWLKVPQGTEL